MAEDLFPAVAQPVPRYGHVGPGSEALGAVIDNRTDLPDEQVRDAVQDRWVEFAGLQFAQPSTFQMYSNFQTSMLARQPFKTPGNVIDEIKLARAVADSDDDVAGALGMMQAIAWGEGLQNHHRDEKTLEFFNQITDPTGLDLESLMEEIHREFLIASAVTTLTLYTRQRLKYFPLKSDTPVEAQLQVPHVAILPAENLRVITNDVMNTGDLAYHVEDMNMKRWLDEYFSPTTKGGRKAMMAIEEPIVAALFTGRIEVPYTDGDINTRGLTLYTLNQRMIHRTSMPKGALPYARPLLTRNFALLEAKRLLNIMDYALLQGGTNYIVVAKKGTDNLPAQQPEVENLIGQVTHASRSGVMVGDHRLNIEIITPDLKELLNPEKRKLLGRKIVMALLRQTEQNTGDAGTQGAVNEMELLSRVISSDRNKLLRHAQSTFYNDTANRNRTIFNQGAPTIWAPKIILAGAKDFWTQVLNARDRGDIPRRWSVEALGFNYEAGLAERQREIARGDDEILEPASVPFSNPGEPQDNNEGRPRGSSPDNGKPNSPKASNGPQRPRRTIQKNAGETVKAVVEDNEVSYFGETTLALIEGGEGELAFGYVMEAEREAIETGEPIRHGPSLIVPVNTAMACSDYRTAKLGEGLRVVVGKRTADDAIVARALRFTEPHYDLAKANEYAIRWGFLGQPLGEYAGACAYCSEPLPAGHGGICPNCGMPAGGSAAGSGDMDVAEAARKRRKHMTSAGMRFCVGCGLPVGTSVTSCPSCGMDPDGDGDVDPAGGDAPGSP